MDDQRAAVQCVQCGQNDDHPKNWGPAGPKHHDCLSFAEKEAIREGNPDVYAVIEAAEAGTHGPELVELILSKAV